MSTATDSFRNKARDILATVDANPIPPQEKVRVVQDLQSVERKLANMHQYYAEAYEKLSQLEKRVSQEMSSVTR